MGLPALGVSIPLVGRSILPPPRDAGQFAAAMVKYSREPSYSTKSAKAMGRDLRVQLQAYMSSPCHIELILSEQEEAVKKEPENQIATSEPKRI